MAYKIKIKQGRKTFDYSGLGLSVGTKKEAEYVKNYFNKRDKKKLKKDRAKLIITKV
jgi:hypothetical protein